MMAVHVDPELLVLDKPAGLLAVPGRVEHDCLAGRAQTHWPGLRVVHRLDMATSGLIAFARSAPAQRRLGEAFASREVRKAYVAVVHGLVADDDGGIELPLAADWPRRPRQRVDRASGKAALTRFRVLRRDGASGRTRLALEPVTGRTHQLRVHLQAIGHPIVGDALYGDGDGDGRLLLHAERLGLPHPRDGRWMEFLAVAPF
jgi:tRNA pseudouridine32 synthase/23S rRNA pseudouridine746 synthase